MMDRLVGDPIPNIRFNVAKSYKVLIETLRKLPEKGTMDDASASGTSPSPKGLELITNEIMPQLEKLQGDKDVDVRYFATIAAGGSETQAAESMERMDTGQ
jgi:serine/threonine-protein phosphatase 2A regulatory subunit A